MSGWQSRDPDHVGLDPAGYDDGEVPVKDDATGQFVPGPGGGGSVAVDDDGVEVVGSASRLNFGDGLDVTDDGGGQVTIDAAGNGGTSGVVCGTSTIPDTETDVDVAHGQDGQIPTTVVVTPREVEPLAVTARTAFDFTVARGGSSGDLDFDWIACGFEQPFGVDVFDEPGAFEWNWAAAGSPSEVEVLVVAGGGGGGTNLGSGGGAGGLIYEGSFAVSGNVSGLVGAGGAAMNAGGDSEFGSLEAIGGGAGVSVDTVGGAGGSGAGSSRTSPGGAGTAGQGHDGGAGTDGSNANQSSGGGGGAGEPGADGTTGTTGAEGGDGLFFAQFANLGVDGWFAGGGGGFLRTGTSTGIGAPGGQGGGGKGGDGTSGGEAGVPNSGGGGGAGALGNAVGGAGGSGIVVVRYPLT